MYLLHHLLDNACQSSERTALIDGDESMTFGQMRGAVYALARRLSHAGVRRGDRVAVFLPKSFSECISIFAPSVMGAVVVPINGLLKPSQVAHIVADCSAAALITTPGAASDLDEALSEVPHDIEIVTLADDLLREDGGDDPSNGWGDGSATGIGEDLAAILYTSGSTGRPKGVMLSHRNMLAGTRIVRTYLSITPEDRLLSLLPFSFDYGLNQLLTTVEQKATLVLGSFRLGDEIVKLLSRHRITGLAGVPTIWAVLAKAAPSLAKTELPNLRFITNSGGAVPTATVQRLQQLLPDTQIFLMYGLTEAFRSTFLPPEEIATRPTSIGRAIPESEVFVINKDGALAGPDEPGILVHRGPTVSMGYWNRPDDTARVLRPNPLIDAAQGCDTVCFSGDLVTQDQDGYLYFVARDDAMIKSAGFRISPSEVEEVIMATGQFSQVAVIGLPDEWVGQKVVAVAVAISKEPDVKATLKFVSDRLPAHMVPKHLETVAKLPQTANGKVDYKLLVSERSG